MKSASFVLAALLLAGCATRSGVADASLPEAKAELTVSDITPATGTALGESHVISAKVAYSIENFQPGVDYYLSPVFASTEGGGVTFNMADTFDHTLRLTAERGTVTLRKKVDREIRSGKLARPVKMWIYAMARSGQHTTSVIGSSGPYEYELAP
jgi:hypothetical protein